MPTTHTLSVTAAECNTDLLGYFRFGAFENGFILTTDQGSWQWLSSKDFSKLLAGQLDEESDQYKELSSKGFIRDNTDMEDIAQQLRQRKRFLGVGPVLHQIHLQDRHGTLSIETAKLIIDHAMQSTSPSLQFELLQLDGCPAPELVEFLISYTQEKNKYEHKDLQWSLAFPAHELSDALGQVLAQHGCGIRTTLAESSLDAVRSSIELLLSLSTPNKTPEITLSIAVGRAQLGHEEAILEQLSNALGTGLATVFLDATLRGPEAISVAEYKNFYANALPMLLRNQHLKEGHSITAASTILSAEPSVSPAHRAPGGIGLCVHGYDSKGRIFPSAMATQLSEAEQLVLGTVGQITYEATLSNPNLKAMAVASILDCLPGFSDHWATPFLAVDPIDSYAQTGDLFERLSSMRIKMDIARLEVLFAILISEDSESKNALNQWLNLK